MVLLAPLLGGAAAVAAIAILLVVAISASPTGGDASGDGGSASSASVFDTRVTEPTVAGSSAWSECFPASGISVGVPGSWSPDLELGPGRCAFRGDDGHMQVSFSGELSLEALARWTLDSTTELAAAHHLMPFGTAPTIEVLTVAGRSARMIAPSNDQEPSFEHGTQLLVEVPEAIATELGWRFLVVWADIGHMRDIAARIRFADRPTP